MYYLSIVLSLICRQGGRNHFAADSQHYQNMVVTQRPNIFQDNNLGPGKHYSGIYEARLKPSITAIYIYLCAQLFVLLVLIKIIQSKCKLSLRACTLFRKRRHD